MQYLHKSLIAVTAFTLLFTSHIWAEEKSPESIKGTTLVSAEETVDLITSMGDLVVIDARKSSDREEAGWIEGSIALPNYDTNEATLAKHVVNKTTPVLFYCNGVKCGRSVDSAKLAVSLGYTKVYWFRGGWEEWISKGLPVSQ